MREKQTTVTETSVEQYLDELPFEGFSTLVEEVAEEYGWGDAGPEQVRESARKRLEGLENLGTLGGYGRWCWIWYV